MGFEIGFLGTNGTLIFTRALILSGLYKHIDQAIIAPQSWPTRNTFSWLGAMMLRSSTRSPTTWRVVNSVKSPLDAPVVSPKPRRSGATTRYPWDAMNGIWWRHEYHSSGKPWRNRTIGPWPISAMCMFIPFTLIILCSTSSISLFLSLYLKIYLPLDDHSLELICFNL